MTVADLCHKSEILRDGPRWFGAAPKRRGASHIVNFRRWVVDNTAVRPRRRRWLRRKAGVYSLTSPTFREKKTSTGIVPDYGEMLANNQRAQYDITYVECTILTGWVSRQYGRYYRRNFSDISSTCRRTLTIGIVFALPIHSSVCRRYIVDKTPTLYLCQHFFGVKENVNIWNSIKLTQDADILPKCRVLVAAYTVYIAEVSKLCCTGVASITPTPRFYFRVPLIRTKMFLMALSWLFIQQSGRGA